MSTLNHLLKYLCAWHIPDALPAQQLCLSRIIALEKIKAMQYWVLAQHHEGFKEDADDFDNDVVIVMLEIMWQVKDQREATELVMITNKLMALTELKGWIKFWLNFSSYLSCIHGATYIPLTYLVQ